jgi:hypothetical protein
MEKLSNGDEQSGDSCGRARNAGWLAKETAQTQTCRLVVWVCTVSFVNLTAGYASRRPHSAFRSSSATLLLL